jgi:flagellar basal body-associated protein FliL
MSDTASADPDTDVGIAPRRGLLGSWKIIALAVLLLAGAGGGGYYYRFVMHGAAHPQQAIKQEPPLPFYLEIKPLVVSMSAGGSETHFVQIGVNLTLSGASAGNLVTAMLPEVQDTLRLSALSFKTADITTPAGVDKMRARMIADVNRMMLQRLGAERIEAVNTGHKELVHNIFFSQLIIE